MRTELETDILSTFASRDLEQKLPQHYRKIIQEFRQTLKHFALFNVSCVSLLLLEISLFTAFLPALGRSYILAFALGGIFLTIFSYLTLLFYLQAKKPDQLAIIRDRLIASCKQILALPYGGAEHHLSIATALSKLSAYLADFEWQIYQIPKWLGPFGSLMSRFAAYCHWKDVVRMKELLLTAAIQEHLEQIKITPTDLETHASLASTYVALSQIYLEPKKTGISHPRESYYQKNQQTFQDIFRKSSELAIEEFQILSHYAPSDPWVHEQLAVGYRNLQQPKLEILEVEILLQLKPQDQNILFRLGALYFQQGQNAKGLQVYEKLKKVRYAQADELIASYGSLLNSVMI